MDLHSHRSHFSEKEIVSVLKSEEKVDIATMIDFIVKSFLATKTKK